MSQKTEEVYHFIGIGGIGMSGLAKILLARGKKVTGSDISESYVTKALEKHGAQVHIGHNEKNVDESHTVIFNSDIPKTNPEFLAAQKYQCKLLHRSDLLLELMKGKKVLAIAGTHGKTTTTALLTHVMKVANCDPAFAVGGMMLGLDVNASDGKSEYFVAEADESDGTFLKYDYHASIVTNIDTDHLAHYGSWEKLLAAFQEFFNKSQEKNRVFYCHDDQVLSEMKPKGIGYGFKEGSELRGKNLKQDGFRLLFDVEFQGKKFENIELNLIGEHNALNALAVFGLALSIGVLEQDIRKAFKSFAGVKRRMEKKGEKNKVKVTLFDDYAHHPTEIKATLKGLKRAAKERRIIAVFQPHRYSRMRYVLNEFDHVFNDADVVVVTDLFAAGETPVEGVSTEKIIENIKRTLKVPLLYIPRKELVDKLYDFVRPHDVVITLGAGDVTKASLELSERIQKDTPKKYKVGLLYGGMSCEHEISCSSARLFIKNLDFDLYDVVPIQIGLDGHFRKANVELQVQENQEDLPLSHELFLELMSCDLFIPVLHGPFGEDGTIQGFLEVLRKPYVGCDVRTSALGMDKVFSKAVLHFHGIRTCDFVTFNVHEWACEKEEFLKKIESKFSYPVFVKPSHLGSSVAVTKATNKDELISAIERALEYDTHVLVEPEIKGREIEFAVRGNFDVQMPQPGEILSNGQAQTYESKYSQGGFQVVGAADLDEKIIQEGKFIAEKVYKTASCQGLARIDFFLDEENRFWLNEINTFPGFTPTSMYPEIINAAQIKMSELFDELIILGLSRFRLQQKIFSFSCKNLGRN